MKPYLKNKLITFAGIVLLIAIYKTDFSHILSTLYTVLRPVLGGFLPAWFLIPLKKRLQNKLSKTGNNFIKTHTNAISAFAVYLIFTLCIVLFIIFLIPVLKDGLINSYGRLCKYYSDSGKFITQNILPLIKPNMYIAGAKNTISFIFNIGMSLIILIYILLEHKDLKKFFMNIFSLIIGDEKTEKAIFYFSRTNKIFTDYFYSKLISSIILGILVIIGFFIIGISYPVFFGVTVIISNMIPVFGAIISGVPIALATLAEYGIVKAITAIAVITVGQQIENNILTPKIVGKSVGVSGFWIIVSLLTGGGVFGFWGMLICIPTAATIKMLYNEISEQKKSR